MSRVDDDRDEARVVERLMQQKRAEEARKTNRVAQDSQFSRLVTQAKETQAQAEQDVSGRSAIEALLESHDAETRDLAHGAENRTDSQHADEKGFRGRMGAKAAGDKLAAGGRTDGRKALGAKLAGDKSSADATLGRNADKAASSKGAAGRASDAKSSRDVQGDRAAQTDKANEASEADNHDHGGGGVKTDADKGGGGKQGGSGGGEKKGDVPQAFRFNPALMAPPPVAKKNDMAGSDRLRRLASEVAQKIVERVRVGTNALGNAEFQIDLRSNVLSGLSVKVSAKNGRISAVFSGTDKDVLKMLEEQEEALKGALSARGLTLDKFKVEAKT